MSPKDALRKWNESNPATAVKFSEGRGRLSREAVAKCSELAASGWSISGYVVTAKSASEPNKAPVVKKVVVNNETVISDFVIFYDEKSYSAVDKTGKVWSMRNACNQCGVSLVQCHCGRPTIFGDVSVSIVKR